MRILLIRRLQRLLLVVSFILFVGIAYLAARSVGYLLPRQVDRLIFITPTVTPTPERDTVALISGHVGYDSGAICGVVKAPTLREVEIVARIAELVRERLENAGMEVLLLEEYDARLTNLDAELMLSLHADSCILANGYKAAYPLNSAIPLTEGRLIACIDEHYAAHTGLPFHPSVTEGMTRYHAFRKVLPATPTVILEMGFLGGDAHLLTREPERVAAGITESIFCFLHGADAEL
jgi:N-acetylmuramoyl-L-alanine amidase